MNTKLTIIVFVACLAAACSPFAPRPDNSRFFILTPLAGQAEPGAKTAPASSTQMAIGVGPIDFPDYLRRQQVVTRSSPNKLELSEEHRWAEPLDRNFTRVLCENLAQLPDVQRVEKYPWSHKNPVDYQVAIDVQRFETSADGQAYLVARWAIKEGESGKDLYRSQTSATKSVGAGESGPSAALSDDLAVLSRDIMTHLADLQQTRIRSANAKQVAPGNAILTHVD
jgi:uncharacterized lipoprotein YmbA